MMLRTKTSKVSFIGGKGLFTPCFRLKLCAWNAQEEEVFARLFAKSVIQKQKR
jgi:hypothetical protein